MPRSTRLRATRLRALAALTTVAAIAAVGLVSAGPASADADPDPATTPDAFLTSAPVDPGTRLTEFALPNPSSLPNDVVAGADGSVWVSTFADKQVLRLSRDGVVTTTAQLTGGPSSLATDGEGGAWAAEYASNAIAHVSAAGVVTEYPVPTANSFPAHIYDAGDLVFFTESNTGNLGRLTQSTGAMVEYPVAGATTLWAIDGVDDRLFVSDTGANGVRQLGLDGAVIRENPFMGYHITQITGLSNGVSGYGGFVTTGDGIKRFTWGAAFNLDSIMGDGRSGMTGGSRQGNRAWGVDSASRTFSTSGTDGVTADYTVRATGTLSEPALTEGRYLWSADQGSGRVVRLDTFVALSVIRHGGADRYELTSDLVHQRYPAGSDTLFVASGEKFADALSVGPIAGRLDAPLLLTPASALPHSVTNEIRAQHPRHIFVVGGATSVSDSTLNEIAALVPGATTERIGGADRYAVSRALLTRGLLPVPVSPDRLYVADGRNFPDALSAVPNAATAETSILLVDGALRTLGADDVSLVKQSHRVDIAGGPVSVSQGIENQIDSLVAGGAVRRGGVDRFEVSDALAADFSDGTASTAYLASGFAFADALAGGAVAGSVHAPLLLAHQDCVPSAALLRIVAMGARTVQLLGGENTLSSDVFRLQECP
ncbi:cell wall-binding repeat-containing protein [Herbiconiux sp. YIM B11900]|uniref:cell wall-binding repeat-containing protein n=1 Tax=Herbiconiux sp. YIM B11900 TaxID=3404131 RepID=UPI003F8471E5